MVLARLNHAEKREAEGICFFTIARSLAFADAPVIAFVH